MSEVKRWHSIAGMQRIENDGDYVLYADYAAMAERLRAYEGCMHAEMEENVKLFALLGVQKDLEKGDKCSTELVVEAIASLASERDEAMLRERNAWDECHQAEAVVACARAEVTALQQRNRELERANLTFAGQDEKLTRLKAALIAIDQAWETKSHDEADGIETFHFWYSANYDQIQAALKETP